MNNDGGGVKKVVRKSITGDEYSSSTSSSSSSSKKTPTAKHLNHHHYDDGQESVMNLYQNVVANNDNDDNDGDDNDGDDNDGDDDDFDNSLDQQRETWNKKLDFLLSVIGFAVDLSNGKKFSGKIIFSENSFHEIFSFHFQYGVFHIYVSKMVVVRNFFSLRNFPGKITKI